MGFSLTNLFNKRIYNIKVSTWLTGIGIGYMLTGMVLKIYHNNKLEKEGICTVGWATKVSYGSYNRKYLEYEYRVDSATYTGSIGYYGSIKEIPKDLYVVVYLKESPYIDAFLYNLTIDSLL